MENAIAVFKWNLPHVRQIQVYSSLTSTNTFAKEQVQQGAEHGTVIWALEQTAGRGRRNRTWFSDISSLTFSLIWWLPNYRKASLVPLALGLGIAQELQIYSSSIKVKWPNDIWAGDKKLAGILCESTRSESGLWVVAGIGINVNRPRFEAAFPAASLEECTGHPLTRLGVLFQVLHGANNGISRLLADELDLDGDFRLWGNFLDREIFLITQGKVWCAWARQVLPDGRLLVELKNGSLQAVMPEEVSLRFNIEA